MDINEMKKFIDSALEDGVKSEDIKKILNVSGNLGIIDKETYEQANDYLDKKYAEKSFNMRF